MLTQTCQSTLLSCRHDFIAAGTAPVCAGAADAGGHSHDAAEVTPIPVRVCQPPAMISTLPAMRCCRAVQAQLRGIWEVSLQCGAVMAVTNSVCRYQGHVSAALVLGGVDIKGPHLFTVYPHGSTDALPYATMGSGSLNAMAVFENGFRCAFLWARVHLHFTAGIWWSCWQPACPCGKHVSLPSRVASRHLAADNACTPAHFFPALSSSIVPWSQG